MILFFKCKSWKPCLSFPFSSSDSPSNFPRKAELTPFPTFPTYEYEHSTVHSPIPQHLLPPKYPSIQPIHPIQLPPELSPGTSLPVARVCPLQSRSVLRGHAKRAKPTKKDPSRPQTSSHKPTTRTGRTTHQGNSHPPAKDTPQARQPSHFPHYEQIVCFYQRLDRLICLSIDLLLFLFIPPVCLCYAIPYPIVSNIEHEQQYPLLRRLLCPVSF